MSYRADNQDTNEGGDEDQQHLVRLDFHFWSSILVGLGVLQQLVGILLPASEVLHAASHDVAHQVSAHDGRCVKRIQSGRVDGRREEEMLWRAWWERRDVGSCRGTGEATCDVCPVPSESG